MQNYKFVDFDEVDIEPAVVLEPAARRCCVWPHL